MKTIKLILVALLMSTVIPSAIAQNQKNEEESTDLGASFAFELQKKLSTNLDISLEEELRLATNGSGFERNALTAGAGYSFLNKRMKVGLFYSYIYQYKEKGNQHRHRYYATLLYKQPLGRFELSWRGRIQGTYQKLKETSKKVNPSYVLRNKLEVTYNIRQSPWEPFLSAETSHSLNKKKDNGLYRVRYLTGASYKINKMNSLSLFLRYDSYYKDEGPDLLGIGVGYKLKL